MLSEHEDLLTANNINKWFGSFNKARAALDKAQKRAGAASNSDYLDDENNVIKKQTSILPTKCLDEDPDYLLICDAPSGSKVFGSKFLIEKFFRSSLALSDGTFKIAPSGFCQIYILWFVLEGQCSGEIVLRHKAIPAVYFLMKKKSKIEYKLMFDALENYR